MDRSMKAMVTFIRSLENAGNDERLAWITFAEDIGFITEDEATDLIVEYNVRKDKEGELI